MATDLNELSKTLFAAADKLWTNSALRPDQYAQPVLALIALRQMEAKFETVHAQLAPKFTGRLKPKPADYQARGAVFLPPEARFSRLLALPGTADLGAELNEAMKGIADANPDLASALPRGYGNIPNDTLREILRLLAPLKIEGDAYGLIFEYFMGEFASSFMQKGGEYFTPASIVKLIVEVIEPFHGAILDPACGSGGMFVHSAEFVRRHHKAPASEIAVFGVEKMSDTLRLCRMNLAVHGLSGDIREANSYYDDPHKLIGKFDFVMANPPFNQPEVDQKRLVNDAGKVDARFPLGLPSVNNANYLWINQFFAALNATGRAGFVMANSASDAGGSEREIRRKLIDSGAVDCIVAVGPNMFYTVTLPVTLWFLDKGKATGKRADEVLFIDARHLFRQETRAHRVFDPEHIDFLGNIVRLWRGKDIQVGPSAALIKEAFPQTQYRDVPGLCRVATRKEIEAEGWSLSPGRYVGLAPGQKQDDHEFREKWHTLRDELEKLNAEAERLQAIINKRTLELMNV
ncbi:N-6 DNA methylase [Rhodomicrobium vannielii ATCC 17100]|uniref:site-specific DNA-methyltransferase (adenine-specific) n=1 Tax=Rhodomicrobium vannielii (strain ATCC 17100 / DSM 162 / LMG 4299 / NCIMB 10020 / ATH 3.1.1) TaxID=648757 RepID=E3I0Q3_RHOVT|nr:class I SAM-dependent DNA methyltransferase [Rhodomicrobium vannielii]ADP71143.1 N-6 DNA methylase [Rhodomicrobium vannielii ATCC 17100]